MEIVRTWIINGKRTPFEGHGVITGPKRKLYKVEFDGKVMFMIEDSSLDTKEIPEEEAEQLIKDAVPWFRSEYVP